MFTNTEFSRMLICHNVWKSHEHKFLLSAFEPPWMGTTPDFNGLDITSPIRAKSRHWAWTQMSPPVGLPLSGIQHGPPLASGSYFCDFWRDPLKISWGCRSIIQPATFMLSFNQMLLSTVSPKLKILMDSSPFISNANWSIGPPSNDTISMAWDSCI